MLGQHAEAIIDFSEAIRIDKDYAVAYRNRSAAEFALVRIENAKSDLQTALELAEHRGILKMHIFVILCTNSAEKRVFKGKS